MNEEEKKAIKFFYNLRATIDESNMLFDEEIEVKHGKETIKQITTILNLIEKLLKENEQLRTEMNSLQKELKQKDKIIDLMAEDIDGFQMECNRYFKDKEEVKQYFENKAKEIR